MVGLGAARRPRRRSCLGEKQWLEIGDGGSHRAELLLLDEPTAGMWMEESTAGPDHA